MSKLLCRFTLFCNHWSKYNFW